MAPSLFTRLNGKRRGEGGGEEQAGAGSRGRGGMRAEPCGEGWNGGGATVQAPGAPLLPGSFQRSWFELKLFWGYKMESR